VAVQLPPSWACESSSTHSYPMCAALAEPDLERYPIRLPVGDIRSNLNCVKRVGSVVMHIVRSVVGGMFRQLAISHRGPFAPSALPEFIATTSRSDFPLRTAPRSLFTLAGSFGPPYPSQRDLHGYRTFSIQARLGLRSRVDAMRSPNRA